MKKLFTLFLAIVVLTTAAAAFAEIKASISGFAGGTRSAPQGLAWVGEKGPELVYFHGGETIIPGAATVTALHQAAMLVGTHGPELMYMQGGETVVPAGQTQTILSQHQKELETINAYASGTDNAERGLPWSVSMVRSSCICRAGRP